MRQAHAREEEIRLEAEKRVKFKGTARIRLEQLYFPWDDGKELNEKNVNRLKAIFQQHGCRRLEVQHHVPAVIDERQFNDAITTAGVLPITLVSPPTADGWPELVFPSRLECLHGRHRIHAGKEILSTGDKWWTVDLYLAGRNGRLLSKTSLLTQSRARHQPGVKNMPHRGVLQRAEAGRRRNLPQDSSISLSAKPELRESMVGSTDAAREEESQESPASSGINRWVRHVAGYYRYVGWNAGKHVA